MEIKGRAQRNAAKSKNQSNTSVNGNTFEKQRTHRLNLAQQTLLKEIGTTKRTKSQGNIHNPSQSSLNITDSVNCPSKIEDTQMKMICENQGKPPQIDHRSLIRQLVLQKHEFSWILIAKELGWTKEKSIKYWQQQIYPEIKLDTTVAGAMKWSEAEDLILMAYTKKVGFNWSQLVLFLPGRTLHSAEGRKRRLFHRYGIKGEYVDKIQDQLVTTTQYMNRHRRRKQLIREIAQNRQRYQLSPNVVIFED